MCLQCEYPKCESTEINLYKYPVYEEDEPQPEQYLCWQHAIRQGFCPSCGWFVAGSGDENWQGSGVCYECYHEETDELTYQNDYYDN